MIKWSLSILSSACTLARTSVFQFVRQGGLRRLRQGGLRRLRLLPGPLLRGHQAVVIVRAELGLYRGKIPL